jgi:type IV pilus assembly protein PilP
MMRALPCLLACLWLAACDAHDDLRGWMDRVRVRHHPAPAALPAAPVPAAMRYEPGARVDPFTAAMLDAGEDNGAGLKPDLRREREPLESFPLASLRLVGSLRNGRDAIALVEIDQRIHQVRIGAHLGQDFGKVVAIGERAVEIDELVPDSGGRWTQRRARLMLQETR